MTRPFEPPPRTAPFVLDGWPFAHPTMLAPMEGVSHPEFRALLAERGGVGIVCTEFVRVSRAPLSAVALRREVVKAAGVPLSVQVMGNDAEKMAEAAGVVAAAGADVVDVNLGCPMPRVVKKGVGAAMLKDPELLHRVLVSMRERVPGLLSAKIRAGFDDAENVVAIARTCEAAGIDFLVVHPRRRADFYDGVADWRIVRLLKESLRIPVIGNGDVWYAADALRMQTETGCDAVMIGRPAIRNPWIFGQIEALREGREPFVPAAADVLAYVHEVRGRYVATYGDSGVLGKLKELVKWLLRGVEGSDVFVRDVLRQDSVERMLAELEARLADVGPGRMDLDAHGLRRLERSGSALLVGDAA